MNQASLVARQIRLRQWSEDIRSCNDRPVGTTVAEWCSEHGITTSAYYWRLGAVRKACIDAAGPGALPTDDINESDFPETSFVEISPVESSGNSSNVVINLGHATISLGEDVSDAFLSRIMEAVYHAQ
ncbi:MAG: hypothetical protein K5657_09475 [Desulfovibrio sp.]|nr:hypothetical protein [Desulfovibrio sp.]